MRIRVVDLETTGFEKECGVVEIGAYDLVETAGVWSIHKYGSQLCNPGMPIPPAACAAHHITDDDVHLCQDWEDVWPKYSGNDVGPKVDLFAAHNAGFERQFITDEMVTGRSWICTWKCALAIWPEASGHSNQELRYWLNHPGLDRSEALVAHRALPDAYVTTHHLAAMLRLRTVQELVQISLSPALLSKVSFGKYRGIKWADAPRDYLQWIVRQRDMDVNVVYTARHYLNGGRPA